MLAWGCILHSVLLLGELNRPALLPTRTMVRCPGPEHSVKPRQKVKPMKIRLLLKP
jgi:hypothetical protein